MPDSSSQVIPRPGIPFRVEIGDALERHGLVRSPRAALPFSLLARWNPSRARTPAARVGPSAYTLSGLELFVVLVVARVVIEGVRLVHVS